MINVSDFHVEGPYGVEMQWAFNYLDALRWHASRRVGYEWVMRSIDNTVRRMLNNNASLDDAVYLIAHFKSELNR